VSHSKARDISKATRHNAKQLASIRSGFLEKYEGEPITPELLSSMEQDMDALIYTLIVKGDWFLYFTLEEGSLIQYKGVKSYQDPRDPHTIGFQTQYSLVPEEELNPWVIH
jgi:hypothetical protein